MRGLNSEILAVFCISAGSALALPADDVLLSSAVPILATTPALAAPSLRPADELSLDYDKKAAAPSLDALAHGRFDAGEDVMRATYAHLLTPDWSVTVQDSVRFPLNEPLGGVGFGQGDLSVHEFALQSDYDVTGDWLMKPYYSQAAWHYQERQQALANDHTVSSFGTGSSYQLWSRTKLSGDVRLQEIRYELPSRDTRSQIMSAGIEQGITRKLSAGGNLGIERRENVAGPTQQAPNTDLHLDYAVSDATKVTVGRRYALTESYDQNVLNESSSAYYSRLSQQLLPRLQMNTTAAYETDEMNSLHRRTEQPSREQSWRFDLAPSYQIGEDLSAQLGYSLRVSDTVVQLRQEFDNTLFLSLKLRY